MVGVRYDGKLLPSHFIFDGVRMTAELAEAVGDSSTFVGRHNAFFMTRELFVSLLKHLAGALRGT